MLIAAMIVSFAACSEDDLDANSVIELPSQNKNALDVWIYNNYVTPYNIEFKYRLEDIELSPTRVLVPAEYDRSIIMAKYVKHLCVEAYSEVAGPDFVRLYFPKIFHLVGSASWLSNGSRVLGEAEGGRKITLFEVNTLTASTSLAQLNSSYFKTIHHEFAHILHQTKNYTPDFLEITGSDYLTDGWDDNSVTTATVFRPRGFITAYSRKEVDEDFVEMLAHYLIYDDAWWTAMYATANSVAGDNTKTGKELIEEKLEIVKDYINGTWGINIEALRAAIQRRGTEIGSLDLTL